MPPTETAPQETRQSREAEHKASLNEMSEIFNKTLNGEEAAVTEPVVAEPVKTEPVKETQKQSETKKSEASKSEASKQEKKEPAKEEKKAELVKEEAKPAKKKSAADAVLADEPVKAEPVEDEVEKLAADPNPNWDKARETMRKQSAQLKEFQAKLETAPKEATEALTKELATLKEQFKSTKEENDRMRDTIRQVDVRLDPEVQSKQTSRAKQVDSLAARIEAAGGSKEAFISAMEMPLAKRSKMLDEALENITSARELSTINAKLGIVETVDEELDGILTNYNESFEKLRAQREQQSQQTQTERQALIESTFKSVREQLPKMSRFMRPAPDDAEGAEQFNADLAKDLDSAAHYITPKTREEAAEWAYKVARYDSVEKIAMERIKAKDAQITALEDQLAKLEGADPTHRGGVKPKAVNDWERPMGEIFSEALNSGNTRI